MPSSTISPSLFNYIYMSENGSSFYSSMSSCHHMDDAGHSNDKYFGIYHRTRKTRNFDRAPGPRPPDWESEESGLWDLGPAARLGLIPQIISSIPSNPS